MEKKRAVYICTGCGIGDALDIEQLSKVATEEGGGSICRNHDNLCSKEGVELIKNDIENEGVNTLIIAACSHRVMYDAFNFENCIVDRVNIREQVAWCQKPGDEDTQMMAGDYLRMSVAKVNNMELPEPYKPEEEISRDILVVGGGLTGMTAALEAAKAGHSVVLVEKEQQLGGFQGKVQNIASFPYKDMDDNNLQALIEEVTQNEKIKVYTGAKVEKTDGSPGIFKTTISQNGTKAEHRIGAIVLAAGWQPYDPKKLDEKLGFGASPNVITNVMFEESFNGGKIVRPSDEKEVTNVGPEKRGVEERYSRLLKEVEQKRKKDSTNRGTEKVDYKKLYQQIKNQVENLYKDKAKAKRETYTTSQNHSNAQNSKMSSALKYLDSISEGVELVNRISKLLSSF